ncbi:MAG: ornithine cyclodeaminase family protein, partial [Actinobacteria bacterium]|nr:ornithine cyclodeaminase family protein [Actinomycetota bacterium]
MTGACRAYGVVAVRIKSAVLSWSETGTVEKYCVEPGTHMGIIMLFSTSDGAPLGIIQDGYLQHMRVGGAAGIGADLLSRRDADTLGLLGSGGMADTYLRALAVVRPLRRVRVFSPTAHNREAFAARMSQELGLEI